MRQALADARGVLAAHRELAGDDVVDALAARLDFRRAFLAAAECPQHVKDPERATSPWRDGLALLAKISSSHGRAKSVKEAFSAKLQRKLASTMPPRPIVELGFRDAVGHLQRLFEDGLEVVGALDYTDSQCLQAGAPCRPLVRAPR